jgi:hypothetical protein
MGKLTRSFIIFMLCLSAERVQAGDILYLKNGSAMEATVTAVYQRHLTGADGGAVMLRQIDSLFTSSAETAAMFTAVDSSITAVRLGDGFSISLTSYVPPLYYEKETRLLTPHRFALLYRFDVVGRLGFSYDGTVLEQLNIVHRFQGSASIDGSKNGRGLTNLNFAFGIGHSGALGSLTTSTVLSAGIYGGLPSADAYTTQLSSIVFLSHTIGYQLFGPVHAVTGFDIFLYREHPGLPAEFFLLYFGMSVRL